MTQIEPCLALDSLQRFVEAQDSGLYATAIKELQQGEKRSHWMWYIFPQIDGIGYSATARRYAIRNLAEARQYLSHPVLGPRLTICMTTALSIQGRTA
jgi:uncharacterized protein (DUF1810 family)